MGLTPGCWGSGVRGRGAPGSGSEGASGGASQPFSRAAPARARGSVGRPGLRGAGRGVAAPSPAGGLERVLRPGPGERGRGLQASVYHGCVPGKSFSSWECPPAGPPAPEPSAPSAGPERGARVGTGVTLPLGARRVPGGAARQEEVPSLEPPSCRRERKCFPSGVRLNMSLAVLLANCTSLLGLRKCVFHR